MGRKGQPRASSGKPWLRPKAGESERQRQQRLNRTCYACGEYIADGAVLDAHEAQHTAQTSGE